MIKGGATIWARKTIDSEIFYSKPAMWFKIWFYLVSRVNHAPHQKWDRGECFIIYDEICRSTGATPDQVKKCLAFLRKKRKVSTTRSTRGVTLKILNYNRYQDLNNYNKDTKSTTKSPKEALEKHQRSTPINKNDKNDKNDTISKSKDLRDKSSKFNPLGASLIKSFETINPACSRFYGNTTQRKACDELIKAHGFENVKTVIEKVLPHTNPKPRYEFPYIDTPHQLFTNWGKLATAFKAQKELKENKYKVAF